MRLRNLIVFLFLLIPFGGLRAECTGWSVAIAELPTSLCSAQAIDFSLSVQHEPEELLTADYRWYVKKPFSDDFELVSTDAATSYTFDEVGIYALYAETKPNECEGYQQSSTITVELLSSFLAGMIDGNQTICYNKIPETLAETAAPSGGNHGRFVRQWQKSTDGSTWSDIDGETGISYQPAALTESTLFRIQYIDSCVTTASNEVTITVRTPATAPVITSSTAKLCYNENAANLTCSTEATGAADESFDYQWQVSTDGVEFSNIDGAIGLTYTTPKQTSAQWYRIVATSSQGCGSVASSPVKVDVYSDWSITNTPTNPLCYMSPGEISVDVTGDEDSYLYQWQEFDGADWQDIASANDASYSIPGKIAGQYMYRALVAPTNGCASKFSEILVVDVYDDLTANTIIGVDTICYNNIPSVLSQTIAPTGGNGSFTYQWQVKATGSWSDIVGANSTTYQPAALTTTTYYRLKATSPYCNKSVLSNEIEVYVRKDLTSPVIHDSPETVCYGFAPALISIPTLATCDIHDSLTYQWQVKTTGDWQNIQGATELTYQPDGITTAHQYRVIATSVKGCGSRESNVRTVNVYDDLRITATGIAPLCYMESGIISVSATGEGETYDYQWQDSTNGIWKNIADAVHPQYSTQSKAGGDYYYRCIVSPALGCTPDTSSVIKVVVYEDVIPGQIAGVDTVCYNNIPSVLSQTIAPTGSNGSFTYQWQVKTTGSWSDIAGANSTTYQPAALTATTYYRLKATSPYCNKSVLSNEIKVYVRKDLTSPVIPNSPETVCYGFAPALISIPTLATCDIHDSLTYQWQIKTTGDWQNIPGATELTYQPDAITTTHQYRVVATSVKGCGSRESNVRTVNVYDDLQISTTGIAPLCYMTRGTIRVSATGEGGTYDYQWQDSLNGVWSDLVGGNTQQYLTQPKQQGDYFYRCIVKPTLGCTPDTSDIIIVSVYDSVAPGSIVPSGADTICYGFIPDAISVAVAASGGDGSYTYQWMRRQEGSANFSYISGATNTTYAPPALYKTTDYQLEVTNKCDVKYTNIVRIYVRDELQAPVLFEQQDTICYNTIPDPIVISTLAKAGIDDSLTYQWEQSIDGVSFTDITGETDTIYHPNALLATHYYRLRATSVKQCGNVTSNIVKVNVYDSLRITAVSPDTLCYMTSTSISVSAVGCGDNFEYQWQDSTNGVWNDISGATGSDYETLPKSMGNYFYRCIVSSKKCDDYYRISPIIKVSVYDALSPGSIIGTDSTCYGYAPAEPLRVDVAATGVDGRYSYQWQKSENDIWKNIAGETNTSYQPEPLFLGSYYRLQVASKCDTLYTNSIFIRVNPLPEVQVVSGPDYVCYNQHEIYSVEHLNPGFTYQWLIERGEGDMTTEAVNTTSVDVLWKTPNSADSVILRVTNDVTGCERDLKLGVTICNEQAPERTIIVRKLNSNILVCQEDAQLVYQWGYTDKSSQQEFPIDDSNRRYVLLPHAFDAVSYDYWLTLRHSETSPCYSRSYYSPTNDALITPSVASVSVPTYVHGRIPVIVNNPNEERIICSIYTLSGESIAIYELGNEMALSTVLPTSLHTGMYVIRVSMGDYVQSFKLIAE